MAPTQSPNWMFTINNPTEDEKPENWEGFKYLIYQEERGEQETRHFQGYVIWEKRKTMGAMKKINARAHWEIRKGSHVQAMAYCSKEETRVAGPFTFGSYDPEAARGQRSDLAAVKQALDEGAPMAEIADRFFDEFMRFERGFRSYRALKAKPRDFKSEVHVFWGPTGTGKSMICSEISPEAFWYAPQKEGKWWDGYDGFVDVVMDEFYGNVQWSQLLRILDRYAMAVETKGGSVNFAPRRIFITSNKDPMEWYNFDPSTKRDYLTLHRRLDYIYYVGAFRQYEVRKLPSPPSLAAFLYVAEEEEASPQDAVAGDGSDN